MSIARVSFIVTAAVCVLGLLAASSEGLSRSSTPLSPQAGAAPARAGVALPQAGVAPPRPAAPAIPAAPATTQPTSQPISQATTPPTEQPTTQAPSPGIPPDYVIGADDVLTVKFRRDKDMSDDVVVRTDGKVTLQLLDDIQAAGLTPEQFRDKVVEAAKRFLEGDPSVTVIVKQINSRKAFITGEVAKPGSYPIGMRLTVVQLIAMAGGLTIDARAKDIVIIREQPGTTGRAGAMPTTFRFNYEDVRKLKNLASNIDLKPGDTVIVP